MTEQTMLEEGFLRRWARRKTEIQEGRAVAPEPAPASAPAPEPRRIPEPAVNAPVEAMDSPPRAPVQVSVRVPAQAPEPAPALPTMEDVAALGADSDFSSFVARGVDQAVRRSALKKLFADPHFNVMDKLDVYIDDYTQASPVSEAMLASLSHAKSVFMRAAEGEEGAQAEPAAEAAPEPAPEAAPVAAAPEAPLQESTEQESTEQPPEQETQ
jgi:hypothetical protein